MDSRGTERLLVFRTYQNDEINNVAHVGPEFDVVLVNYLSRAQMVDIFYEGDNKQESQAGIYLPAQSHLLLPCTTGTDATVRVIFYEDPYAMPDFSLPLEEVKYELKGTSRAEPEIMPLDEQYPRERGRTYQYKFVFVS